MAPRRLILKSQLEILVDFLEENRDISKGLTPGAPKNQDVIRQKWTDLAEKLNAVPHGALRTPASWRKYWFEWRWKCRQKAANLQRNGANSKKFNLSLHDLEVRVLGMYEKSADHTDAERPPKKPKTTFITEDSDSEPLETIVNNTGNVNIINDTENEYIVTKTRRNFQEESKHLIDNGDGRTTPPPKWATELEERKIAAQERTAAALESIARALLASERRRAVIDRRVADTLDALTGCMQELNNSVQEAKDMFL